MKCQNLLSHAILRRLTESPSLPVFLRLSFPLHAILHRLMVGQSVQTRAILPHPEERQRLPLPAIPPRLMEPHRL
jgi:hypothetical protein